MGESGNGLLDDEIDNVREFNENAAKVREDIIFLAKVTMVFIFSQIDFLQ